MGCYNDADGNGSVNGMDLWGMKMNLGKTHGFSPKQGGENNIAVSPREFELYQNFPNPFNPSTNISFDLSEECFVNLKVMDVLGHQVAELVNGVLPTGSHSTRFQGAQLPSGLYYYTINARGINSANEFTQTRKMSLMK
jgi:hypothetical protein